MMIKKYHFFPGVNPKDKHRDIKKAIWIYFYLLIFEGALRKWFLPFLATPLLLVRDPVVIWCIARAVRAEVMPKNAYITGVVSVGIISILTAVLFGHGNPFVAFYGSRPFLFYVPFAFIVGKILNREDILEIGKTTLRISILMTVIMVWQFYSPQSAWINRGVGGDEAGSGFSGALGYFRPSAVFSFTNGTALFYSFLSGFVFYFWFNIKLVNKWLLIASTICLVIAIPISISRTLMFSVAVIALFMIFVTAKKPKYFLSIIGAAVGLFMLVLILSQVSFFQTGLDAFTARFNTANEQEGGLEGTLGDRYLGAIGRSFSGSSDAHFFGNGSGVLSNVGTKLLSGNVVSGISEGELGRLIYELGLLMGLIIIFLRVGLNIEVFIKSFKKLSVDDLLPWSLLGFFSLQGFQANWSQATSLGFSIFGTGMVLASLQSRRK